MARAYQLRIYDVGYTTLQETINDEALISGSINFELSGEETLRFQIDRDHVDFPSLALGKTIELFHTVEAAVVKVFRIVSMIDQREQGVYRVEAMCEGLKYDLNKNTFAFSGSIIEQTPLTHINEILLGTVWASGTVIPMTKITVQYDNDAVLSALEKVRKATGHDLEFSTAGPAGLRTVNLRVVGNQASTSTIEWKKNLQSLRRERAIPEATRIYGIGGEGANSLPMRISKATHRISAINVLQLTLDSDKIVPSNNSFNNTLRVEKPDLTTTLITGSGKNIGLNDFLVVESVAGLVVGDKIRIVTNASPVPTNLDYIFDKSVEDSYGQRTATTKDENFSDVVNLIGPYNSSALSGTYTAGICEGWTAIGSPTLTENTISTFVINGSKSQKVVVAAYTATPSTFTTVISGAGELNGTYTYKLSWVTSDGEGPLSAASLSVAPVNQRILITMSSAAPSGVTHWRIYRTKAGGATYFFIADVPIAQTTFFDTLGDVMLSRTSPGNTAAGGQGVQRTFTAVVGSEFASLVWIFVESGRVRIELEAGDIVPEKELGTSRATPVISSTTKFIVKTEGLIATATAGKIRIVAHEGAATFYVDSAVVVATAYAPNSDRFVADNDATQLWYAAFDELQRKKVVAEKINLSAVDLYETVQFAGQNKISIGDLISVIDTKLGVNISVRVIKKSFDLLQPWNAQFEVSASPDRFTSNYADRIKRENTVGTALSRQVSRIALANRNLLGSVNQPVVEIMQIEA